MSQLALTHVNFQNAEPETAPKPMDVPEPMDAPEAVAQKPEEAAAPVDVDDIPAIAIDPPTRRRIPSAGIEREALDLTEAAEHAADRLDAVPASPTRMRHRARQNSDPEPAPEPIAAPEAAAHEPEEAAAPVDVATSAPTTRRRLRSAGNERSGALDLTEPEQVAVPVNVAGPQRKMHHRASKKSAGAPSRRARVQNSRSRNSAAVTLPRADCRSGRNARSVADVPPTIHNVPFAPPAGRKNRRAQRQERAAHARRCHQEQNEALAAANVYPAPASPGATTAPVVVDLPTTRRRRASLACSLVAPVSTRRRAASRSESRPAPSSVPAPPPTSRPAAPRRSAPGPSVRPAVSAPVPAPRAREVSVARQDAIALIGQSMHPTRVAVKQLRSKNPNGGQGSVSDAPEPKKPRKTARLQQVKRGRGGKK